MKLSRLLVGSFGLFALSSLAGCIVCGDQFVDAGETCDDGNAVNGDGCDNFCQVEVGSATFSYVLLDQDANGQIVASPNCDVTDAAGNVTTVASVKFLIGNDPQADNILDDADVVSSVSVGCNQFDEDNNGVIDQNNANGIDELGIYDSGNNLLAGTFDAFAVEYLDANNTPIPWQTFDVNTDATRFTFEGANGTTITPNTATNLTFSGDAQQTSDGELQTFFGL